MFASKSVPPMQTLFIPVLGPSIVQILENAKVDHSRQDGQTEHLPKRHQLLNLSLLFPAAPHTGQANS